MTGYATAPLVQAVIIAGKAHRSWIGENAELAKTLPISAGGHSLVISCADAAEGSAILHRLSDAHRVDLERNLVSALYYLRGHVEHLYTSFCVTGPDGPLQPIRMKGHHCITEFREYAMPLLSRTRTAERLVGRPDDDTPAWLNQLLDDRDRLW